MPTLPTMSRELACEALGLNPDASIEEIKKAFNNLIKKAHPDRDHSLGAHERTIEILNAHKWLLEQENTHEKKDDDKDNNQGDNEIIKELNKNSRLLTYANMKKFILNGRKKLIVVFVELWVIKVNKKPDLIIKLILDYIKNDGFFESSVGKTKKISDLDLFKSVIEGIKKTSDKITEDALLICIEHPDKHDFFNIIFEELKENKTLLTINSLKKAIDFGFNHAVKNICAQLIEQKIVVPEALVITAYKRFKEIRMIKPEEAIKPVIEVVKKTGGEITEASLMNIIHEKLGSKFLELILKEIKQDKLRDDNSILMWVICNQDPSYIEVFYNFLFLKKYKIINIDILRRAHMVLRTSENEKVLEKLINLYEKNEKFLLSCLQVGLKSEFIKLILQDIYESKQNLSQNTLRVISEKFSQEDDIKTLAYEAYKSSNENNMQESSLSFKPR